MFMIFDTRIIHLYFVVQPKMNTNKKLYFAVLI